MDLSEYTLEPILRRDEEFLLSRGRPRLADAPSILLLTPVSSRPTRETLKKIEHEYSFRSDLDASWAVRPLALSQLNEQRVLVLENPGGESLDRLLQGPMEVEQFLRVAIGLAAALGQLHKRDLIHKDLRPSNFLVNCETGQAWLMGFGIASRVPRERQLPEPPEFIAGTLPYMSPEQTGRMNRSVDSRSDLYSLGVTLYEMLTGRLPFTASDPMEWVHCHIARRPTAPNNRLTTVPTTISSIIMKLLAKTAEERYQTASGAESDLRRCLAEWEAKHRIKEFALGQKDMPNRLLIPEKLYGRAREINILCASFDRVVANGTPALVLVSGYSGVGKSSVVNELHKVLVPPRGFLVSGKFDQYKRNIPYATLAQAFQSLVGPLLGKSDAELLNWRDSLTRALGLNGRLITDLVPQLNLIMGEQLPVSDLPLQDAQRRFQLVFRQFIGVFARPEHPLALFIDDLQWLDAATLDVLEDLLTHPDVKNLLLIGAYRNNEVNATHPLMRKLEKVRHAGVMAQEIVLAPLSLEDLEELIADSLHTDQERASPLAQLVFQKTAGNPFFAIQFIYALAEESLLSFDHHQARWTWDLNRIHAKGYTENVVELMVRKLSRLPPETQNALQLFACLGNRVEFAILKLVYKDSMDEMHSHLREAVRMGLVLQSEYAYSFLHDRVQEAAYSLMPEAERWKVHLRIGRLIATHTPPAEIEEKIFEIVSQFNRSASLIDLADERKQVAEFNLLAGKKAMASTAFVSALAYFVAARAMLADDSWEQQYRLTVDLECYQAECEFLTGQYPVAEGRLSALSVRVTTIVDRAAIARLRVVLYTTMGQFDKAVEVGLEYLLHVGIDWSPHPTEVDVREECQRMLRLLNRRPIHQLLDLPLMTDPTWHATMDVLTELAQPADFTDSNLLDLVEICMVDLSLEHGNCDASCFAYACLNTLLGIRFGEYQAAFSFGQLACDLVEKRGLGRFKSRVYTCFAALCVPWTKHLPGCRALIRHAIDAAKAAGDITYEVYSSGILATNLLISGEPLDEVQREAEKSLAVASKAQFSLFIDCFIGQHMLIRNLRGLDQDDASMIAGSDKTSFEKHFEEQEHLAIAACCYRISKLQAQFFALDYAGAIMSAAEAKKLLWSIRSQIEHAEYHFYVALSRAAACDSATSTQGEHLEALLAHQQQIVVWAENCPDNFKCRAALVGAEVARIEGRLIDAEQLYEQAIRSAQTYGFVQIEAIANEFAARFYAARGFKKIAFVYLLDARHCYLRWGADGKVKQLDDLHPHLRDERPSSGAAITIGAPVEHLDLATVIKVSQAVSGEIVLGKLIDTLMRTAIEHAGAERGLLILPKGTEMRVEAEARISGGNVVVHRGEMAENTLPESIVHFVARTHEPVILGDAAADKAFSDDPYICQRHARSILCLPLVNLANLIGILYLENNLAPRVFTPSRVSVLKLLASQAAISLVNSGLYADVKERETRFRRLIDANIMGVLIWNFQGRVLDANEAFLNLLGYSREELVSADISLADLTPPECLERDARAIADLKESGTLQPYEKEYFRKDGSRVPVLLGAALFEEGGNEGVAFVVDLSEQKRTEEALQRSQERWHSVFTNSAIGVALTDEDGRFIATNSAYQRMLGYSEEDLRRMTFMELTHEEYLESNLKQIEELKNGTRTQFQIEKRYRRKDGSWVWVTNNVSLVPGSERMPQFTMSLSEDITERKRAEEERERLGQAQVELAHINRVSMMGELTASLAHEIKQPISAAVTNAGACVRWLSRDVPNVEEAKEAASRLIQDVTRASDIISRIGSLFKKSVPPRESVDVNELIRGMIVLVRGEASRYSISIDSELANDLPRIVADRVQLQQVLMNLMLNGLEAMKDLGTPGKLTLTSRREDGQLVISVADTGLGVAQGQELLIFDAFFTSKSQGTGMGLPISRSIVESHGGRLWVSSKPGSGATFQFTLTVEVNDRPAT